MRRLAFLNPVLKLDRLVFVERFGQETYPDVCLNHRPWVSRPGGGLCVLTLGGPETGHGYNRAYETLIGKGLVALPTVGDARPEDGGTPVGSGAGLDANW